MSVPEEVVVQGTRLFNVPGNIITAFFRNTDLLRNFRWRLTFPSDVDIRPDDCQSLDVPFPSIEPIPWTRDGSTIYFAYSAETPGSLVVNLYERSDARVMLAIEVWKTLIRNADGTRNYPIKYKKNIILQLTDGLKVPKMEITFKGCWPTRTTLSPLSYDESSNKVILSQVFSIDTVVFKPTGASFTDIFRNPSLANLRNLVGF